MLLLCCRNVGDVNSSDVKDPSISQVAFSADKDGGEGGGGEVWR